MGLLEKIVSGGQTGADRAALDFAIENAIPHGGWCPKGRKCEQGVIPPQYQLRETPSEEYIQRTEWNVRDSDGTVVFSIGARLSGGSNDTIAMAGEHRKPTLHISREAGSPAPERELARFIEAHHIKVLNVAGPRSSEEPELYDYVKSVLGRIPLENDLL